MIFDSSVLIDVLRNRPDAVQKIRELEKKGEPMATTTISVFEILQGIRSVAAMEEEQKILGLIQRFTVFPFDLEAAREAGKISSQLIRKGMQIEPTDCMIAGIAMTRNETVLTRNNKHFSKILKLQLETY